MALTPQNIKKATKPKPGDKRKGKEKPDDMMSGALKDEFKDFDDDEEEEGEDQGSDEVLNEGSGFKLTKIQMIGIGVAVGALLIIGAYFLFFKKAPPPPPAPPTEVAQPETPIDEERLAKEALYKEGIGKEFLDETNVYEQGNLENFAFRKDFTAIDQPEKFATPIRITTVKDGVSYTKHRSVLGDGVEVYWVDGEYKGRKVTFTIPYSIYQVIDTSGVMDVTVEVVTDKNNSKTVTNFTALPPAKSK